MTDFVQLISSVGSCFESGFISLLSRNLVYLLSSILIAEVHVSSLSRFCYLDVFFFWEPSSHRAARPSLPQNPLDVYSFYLSFLFLSAKGKVLLHTSLSWFRFGSFGLFTFTYFLSLWASLAEGNEHKFSAEAV